MRFSSLPFLFGFLPITLAIYFAVPLRWRNLALLLASLVFYGWGEPVYISIMVLSILIDYTHGLLVEKYRSRDKLARWFVAESVLLNLGLLGFFKYWDFFAANLSLIPGVSIPTLGLPLPIGISFYIFQAMSYLIDVCRREVEVQKNVLTFGTYVTLFPQLIAGPIVRYRDVAEMLESRRENLPQFSRGVQRFVVGLSKKVLLANTFGAAWNVLQATTGTAAAWLGLLCYTLQIYFDFSGYSDMAIGLGQLFGFTFLENFNYPYISASITEFWRRWHISLSTWFKEYVYIPLGGNRKGLARQIFNILVVWLLTGLWHGASWNFVLWGGYYAALLILEKCWLLLAVCAVILAAAFTVLYWGRPYAEHSVLDTPLCSLFAWIAVIAVLAFMKKWGNISNTLTRWMAAKSWGLYLFHYLFIVMTAYYLNMYTKLPAVLLYLFVAAAGFAGAYLAYEIIRRIPVLRWIVCGIGGKKK